MIQKVIYNMHNVQNAKCNDFLVIIIHFERQVEGAVNDTLSLFMTDTGFYGPRAALPANLGARYTVSGVP